jgi:hypothetical protein
MQDIINIYYKDKIGKCISWGSDHTVYDYDKDKVIKFSFVDFLINSHNKTLDDYATCKRFFGDYLLDTTFAQSENRKFFAGIQEKILGHYLSREDFINEEVKKQFKEIMDACKRMTIEGYGEIDLLGSGGIFRSKLSNIFVTSNNQLKIIDSSVWKLKGQYLNPVRYIFLFIVRPIALWQQNKIIKEFNKLC